MNPFFFGRSARQLFGAYDPAESQDRDQAVVLCPALGDDYLFAHPTYRLLARQLAGAGFHVLRFDYYGTGDSAGEFEDASQDQWLEDIDAAITEVRDLSQASRVCLVGLRYGAALAAMAARDRSEVDQLVLWDAVTNGEIYLAEIGAVTAVSDQAVDASGVVMTPAIRADIAKITLQTYAGPLPHTLITTSGPTAPGAAALLDFLKAQHIDCAVEHSPDEPVWRERRIGFGAMSVATVRGIVSWLS
ncbi:MAG TPA: alpha/beta fold hydrolase [Gemmatimonadaceae bacterium]